MECLTDLVLLRNFCDDTVTEGAIYINDLPFGTLKMLSEVANEEDVNAKNLFDRSKEIAYREVVNDFLRNADGLKFLKEINNEYHGTFGETTYSGEAYFYFSVIKDPYVTGCMIDINLKVDTAQTITLNRKVDGVESTSMHDLVVGENVITLNIDAQSSIEIKADVVDAYHTYYKNYSESCNKAHGVVAHYKHKCSEDKVICSYADELKFALRWRVLAVILEEAIARDGRNELIRNSKTEMKYYFSQVMGGEDPLSGAEVRFPHYWRELEALKKRTVLQKSRCTNCNDYSYKEIF